MSNFQKNSLSVTLSFVVLCLSQRFLYFKKERQKNPAPCGAWLPWLESKMEGDWEFILANTLSVKTGARWQTGWGIVCTQKGRGSRTTEEA